MNQFCSWKEVLIGCHGMAVLIWFTFPVRACRTSIYTAVIVQFSKTLKFRIRDPCLERCRNLNDTFSKLVARYSLGWHDVSNRAMRAVRFDPMVHMVEISLRIAKWAQKPKKYNSTSLAANGLKTWPACTP
ncbi:hypothetical protein RJT34_31488 [Clitoria ternatea]|uniref:Uncharacterized protein n=1 Tax=Clitoria ternatea TaxID=43366 RepID=A0AAN9I3L9_CLITE